MHLLYRIFGNLQYTFVMHYYNSPKAGKTRVPIPICLSEEGPRTVNGGPPANMVEKQIVRKLNHLCQSLQYQLI